MPAVPIIMVEPGRAQDQTRCTAKPTSFPLARSMPLLDSPTPAACPVPRSRRIEPRNQLDSPVFGPQHALGCPRSGEIDTRVDLWTQVGRRSTPTSLFCIQFGSFDDVSVGGLTQIAQFADVDVVRLTQVARVDDVGVGSLTQADRFARRGCRWFDSG